MALQQKSRTKIYTAMAEMAGEEAAADMLAQFPAREYDDPVTKDHLALRVAELRAEMHDLVREQTTRLIMWMVTTMVALVAVNATITFAIVRFA